MKRSTSVAKRQRRRARVRARIQGTAERPRLSVYRSNRSMSVQLIDDVAGRTLATASTRNTKSTAKEAKTDAARHLGEQIAEQAIKLQIRRIVFDRNGYAYHGRVAAVAEGARAKGLEF